MSPVDLACGNRWTCGVRGAANIRSVHEEGDSKRKPTAPPPPDEEQRLDRNLTELLSELRIAIPGVQVLFAFLLSVPFAQRFGRVSQFERIVYLVTLLLAAIALALLVAPSAYHRMDFHLRDRAHLVAVANRLTVAGFAFLALAMTSAVLLVTRYLFSEVTTIVVASLVGAMFVAVWYVLPVRRRLVRRAELAKLGVDAPG